MVKTQVIIHESQDIIREPRIVDEFQVEIHPDLASVNMDDLSSSTRGVPDYWNEPKFHQRIAREAKHRLPQTFPFNIFNDLKVKVHTKTVATLFKMRNNKTMSVPYGYTQGYKMNLPRPMHAMAHEPQHKDFNRSYDAVYVVVLECKINHNYCKRVMKSYKPKESDLEILEFKSAFEAACKRYTDVHPSRLPTYISGTGYTPKRERSKPANANNKQQKPQPYPKPKYIQKSQIQTHLLRQPPFKH